MFSTNRTCVYKGVAYQVISVLSVLDNDLLLAVEKDEFDKAEYPMRTVLIPDIEISTARKAMRVKTPAE